MTSDIVREGKAAWGRLKQGGGTWEDWKAVGYTLLEGRTIAMRSARSGRVGYGQRSAAGFLITA